MDCEVINMKKIALWEPTDILKKNAEKLLDYCEIVGNYTNDLEKQKQYGWEDICTIDEDIDCILVPLDNYKNDKELLINELGFNIEKVHTYEEYRVIDVATKVPSYYKSMNNWLGKNQDGYYHGKVVIIFGGGSGIGEATADVFFELGAYVIIAGRNEEKLKKKAESINSNRFKYLVWDITKVVQFEEKLECARKTFDKEIDIVVNSAGILRMSDFFSATEEEFDSIINVNLKGVYFICQGFAKYYIDKRIRGHIVNVVSSVGTLPTVKPYGISKWGLYGFTKGLGMNLAEYGIIVNGVAPGGCATEMIGYSDKDTLARRAAKTGRLSLPCEIAQIIVALSGFIGEQMPGIIIQCDGGDQAYNLYL